MKTEEYSEDSLEKALYNCRLAARRGYTIAKNSLEETGRDIERVANDLFQGMSSMEHEAMIHTENTAQLKDQLAYIINVLEHAQEGAVATLEERRKRLDTFSITLFGRTMAGKSTLMEILTHGNGASIGNGVQRTTRDVRVYTWNGLEVTDVPGIAAFEGAKDEEIAFTAAAQADLVLFLITDDAPQPAEAECLAHIRSLGRPILGICNVKIAIDDEDDLFLFLRNPQRSFDEERIKQLLQQFQKLVNNYTTGMQLPFLVTHLRSRFLANLPYYEKDRIKLIEASRFNNIEASIVREVKNRGTFLRVKNFIDCAVTHMRDTTNKLLDYSAQNSTNGSILVSKRTQFAARVQKFKESGSIQINTLVSRIIDSLRNEIPSFAEEHYEDSAAGENWEKLVKKENIQYKVEALQRELFNEYQNAVNATIRETGTELSIISNDYNVPAIKMDRISDSKTVFKGVVALAADVLSRTRFAPAAPVVAGVGGFLSCLFVDREEKARRAREQLSKELNSWVDNTGEQFRKQINGWFYRLKEQIDGELNKYEKGISNLLRLADAQRSLAWTLNDRQKNLNYALVKEALDQLNAAHMLGAVSDIARDLGSAVMLLIKQGVPFPEEIRMHFEMLLGERVLCIKDTGDRVSILSQAIGSNCAREGIGIEPKMQIAHVPFYDMDEETKSRVRLAQQLTHLHVISSVATPSRAVRPARWRGGCILSLFKKLRP